MTVSQTTTRETVSIKDLEKLFGVGQRQAQNIKLKIHRNLKEKGKHTNYLFVDDVAAYTGLDRQRIKAAQML